MNDFDFLSSVPAEEVTAAVDALGKHYHRQARFAHPEGTFDKAGRWYPTKDEHAECCGVVREPSRAWPNSLSQHCRTLQHCEGLVGARHDVVLALRRHLGATYGDARGCFFGDTTRLNTVLGALNLGAAMPPPRCVDISPITRARL